MMAENYAAWCLRQAKLEAHGEMCPTCGEPFVSKAGVSVHKARGCKPVVDRGARDRVADLVVALVVERRRHS